MIIIRPVAAAPASSALSVEDVVVGAAVLPPRDVGVLVWLEPEEERLARAFNCERALFSSA
jgi:hypothetical protein